VNIGESDNPPFLGIFLVTLYTLQMKGAFYTVLIVWLAFCPFLASAAEDSEEPFFARVLEQARILAAQPYVPLDVQLPQPLAELDYDRYRNIRFQPAHSLWHGEGLFEVQFFHLGFLYSEPVLIYVVENSTVRPLPFDKEMFDYGKTGLKDSLPTDLSFAGFRIHYPLHRPDYADEVAVFLGASYFRMVGRTQTYGISARGLAIDTALPAGEEFPAFREFWLVRPTPGATSMTIYALLDSKSVTGAYRFSLTPDTETVMDVQATLFARAEVQRLGIAPLTSMFFAGENQARFIDDYRPEVHDSDGLLTHTGKGEWIWRPLSNPKKLHVSSLLDEAPRGFGLLQRDRNFDHYLDLEAHFERRPSFWVEPRGETWGKGAVYLVEIPVREEFHDNIVAFWVSNQPLKVGESRTFAYRLHASLAPTLNTEQLGYIERTRSSRDALPVPGTKEKPPSSLRRFMVEFAGGDLALLEAAQPVKAELSVSAGEVSDLSVQRLPDSKGWRVSFRLAPSGTDPIDMRLFLMLRDKRLTETWNYVWSPNEID
jgi:glucans biosynthesis protein